MAARSFGAAVFAVLTVGCKGAADDDVEPAFVPKTVAFEGKIDPKYVGDWGTASGDSRLKLKLDGEVSIESTTRSQSGKSTSRFNGRWLAQDGSLLVQYGDATHDMTTLKYVAKLSGNKLVLQQSGGRLTTVYTIKH